jgi:GPH family glycoside/pentoside/hexuronide:cation symporter
MKLTSKIGYGLGDMGAGIMWGMVSGFLLIYMTDSVGMAAATLGTVILIARVFDGVSDAFMGTIIDNTHTKMGKAKPWYLGSIIPLTITYILLFNLPKTMSEGTLKIYFFILYFALTAIFYTIKDVSYNSLPALVTDSTKDRISMNIIRFVFSLTTSIVISVVTVPVLNSMGGLSSQVAWSKVTIVFAIIGAITLTISALSVKEINIAPKSDEEKKEKSSLPFYKAFAYTFSNKYFIMCLVSTLASMT